MGVLTDREALDIAQALVEQSPADETEITVESQSEGFVRFADVGPTQNADRERVDVAVRTRKRDGNGWREARAVTGSLEAKDLKAALERSLLLCDASPVNEEASDLGGAVEVAKTSLCKETQDHGFEAKAEVVQQALAACQKEGVKPAGLLQTTTVSRAIVNSAGRAVHGYFNRAGFSLTATNETGAGIGDSIARSVDDLTFEVAIERAVEKARRSTNPKAIDPGEYTVVLEPAAVGAILLFASYSGFGGREVVEESSFLCGRIGTRALSESISIEDDAQNSVFPGWSFDGEGTPRQRVQLVDRGTLQNPVTDTISARKLGLECTGHGAQQPSSDGPMADNLVVAAGDQSLEELIGGVERGLLVTQFHYTNMIEPRDLTLTGMTRNGTFLIENGKLSHGVRNLRFTEKLVGAFSRVSGVSKERAVTGALFDGDLITPALRIEGFRFTSTSDF